MSVEVHLRGATVEIWAYFKNWEGDYASPDQGAKVSYLKDPDGTAQVEDTAMTEDDTGKWVYRYDTESDGVVGWWRYRCIGTDGAVSPKYSIKDGSFELKA